VNHGCTGMESDFEKTGVGKMLTGGRRDRGGGAAEI
jgi:hypothetical protein